MHYKCASPCFTKHTLKHAFILARDLLLITNNILQKSRLDQGGDLESIIFNCYILINCFFGLSSYLTNNTVCLNHTDQQQ